jgi:pimeloyl-ACP methyl ester carboxylesterase
MSTAESGVYGAAALAVEHLDELIVGSIQEVHTSISSRVFAVGDRVSGHRTLTHRIHNGVSAAVYGGVGISLRGASRALRAVDEAGMGPNIEESPQGRFVVSAVNGLIGDTLRETSPRFSFEMGVRHDGRHVPLEPDAIAASYPDASDGLVVFVHGLCETEDYWLRKRRPKQPDLPEPGSYGRRLSDDEGWSPVFIRANTGVSIAESGVALSALLGRLVEIWPTEVRRIALVGHSMGGLIIRSACAVGSASDWTDRVSDIVALGTPHLGSPVERSIARGLLLAERVPELAPYRRIFSKRSAAVLELAHGLPDLPPLEHVSYHLVAASLSRSERHPLALSIGDLLVQPRSAFGLPRQGAPLFPGANTLHVPRADHFDLLNHDEFYAALRRWLTHRGPRSAAPPAAVAAPVAVPAQERSA